MCVPIEPNFVKVMPKIVTLKAERGFLIKAQLIIVIGPRTETFSIF